MLHACFSILLFMYKGKISRWLFKVVFLEMRIFTDTSVCDVADDLWKNTVRVAREEQKMIQLTDKPVEDDALSNEHACNTRGKDGHVAKVEHLKKVPCRKM